VIECNNDRIFKTAEIPCEEISDPTMHAIMPLVSVTMITFNHAPYIAEAIEGVLNQKTKIPLELIIGEDCSTDNTREICKNYAKNNEGIIKLLPTESNLGMMPNFQRTLKACTGKYIALCEGDDYWIDPNKLQKQVNYMEAHPECAMCFSAAEMIKGNGRKVGKFVRPNKGDRIFTVEDMILGGGSLFHTGAVVLRKNIIDNLPSWYFECPIGDYPLALICAYHGTIAYMDEVMSVYRIAAAGSWTESMKSNKERWIEQIIGIIEMLKCFNIYSGGKFEAAVNCQINNHKAYGVMLKGNRNCLKDPQNKKMFQHLSVFKRMTFIIGLYLPRTYRILFRIKYALSKNWIDKFVD